MIGAVLTVQFKQKFNSLKRMNVSNKGRSVFLFDLNGQDCSDQDNLFVKMICSESFLEEAIPIVCPCQICGSQ